MRGRRHGPAATTRRRGESVPVNAAIPCRPTTSAHQLARQSAPIHRLPSRKYGWLRRNRVKMAMKLRRELISFLCLDIQSYTVQRAIRNEGGCRDLGVAELSLRSKGLALAWTSRLHRKVPSEVARRLHNEGLAAGIDGDSPPARSPRATGVRRPDGNGAKR